MSEKYIILGGVLCEYDYPVLIVDTEEQAKQKVKEFEEGAPEYCEEYLKKLEEIFLEAEERAGKRWTEDSDEYWQEWSRVVSELERGMGEKYSGKTADAEEADTFYYYVKCDYEGRGDDSLFMQKN